MLTNKLQNKYIKIVTQAIKMVNKNVDENDLGQGVDYVAIYTKTADEFDKINKILSKNGTISIESPLVNYYKLFTPFSVSGKNITLCGVASPNAAIDKLGYADFEPKNYYDFKKKYLSKKYFTSVIHNGEEMLEICDPDFDVKVYILSNDFYLD